MLLAYFSLGKLVLINSILIYKTAGGWVCIYVFTIYILYVGYLDPDWQGHPEYAGHKIYYLWGADRYPPLGLSKEHLYIPVEDTYYRQFCSGLQRLGMLPAAAFPTRYVISVK